MQPGMTGMQLAQNPAMLQGQTIANLGQQQLQGIPSSINSEALLRQSQMEGLINILGLSGGGGTGDTGGVSETSLIDALGDIGSDIWNLIRGKDGSSDLSTPLGDFTGEVNTFTAEELDALARGEQIDGGN
jgi:hypothetical protein